jgi:hypothetical protein
MTPSERLPPWVKAVAVTLALLLTAAVIGGMFLY